MHDSKILVSLPGSDVMNAVWLNDGTLMLLVPRLPNGGCGNEFGLWYQYFYWVKTDKVDQRAIQYNQINKTTSLVVNPNTTLESIHSFLSDESNQQIRKPGDQWGSCG